METKLFETIYGSLKKRVDWCDENLKPLHGNDSIQTLQVKEFSDMVVKATSYMSEMDKIYTEINHIYGMGNLTVCQQSKLMSMMNRFTSYRSDIKYLAGYNNVKSTPKLPEKSEYKLTTLADVTLVRYGDICRVKVKEEKPKEVNTEINDSLKQTIITAINNKLPYNIVHEADDVNVLEVRFDVDDVATVDQVNKDIANLLNESKPKRKNFLKQVCKLGDHYKFNWDVEGPGKMVGRIKLTNQIWPRAKELAGIH